jgi:hypothetical protein
MTAPSGSFGWCNNYSQKGREKTKLFIHTFELGDDLQHDFVCAATDAN